MQLVRSDADSWSNEMQSLVFIRLLSNVVESICRAASDRDLAAIFSITTVRATLNTTNGEFYRLAFALLSELIEPLASSLLAISFEQKRPLTG